MVGTDRAAHYHVWEMLPPPYIEMLRIRGEAAHRHRMAYLESKRVAGGVTP